MKRKYDKFDDYADHALDLGVSGLFNYVEKFVPLPYRIFFAPLMYFVRRRVKHKLRKVFARVAQNKGDAHDYAIHNQLVNHHKKWNPLFRHHYTHARGDNGRS